MISALPEVDFLKRRAFGKTQIFLQNHGMRKILPQA
jgi:hypothetical protein